MLCPLSCSFRTLFRTDFRLFSLPHSPQNMSNAASTAAAAAGAGRVIEKEDFNGASQHAPFGIVEAYITDALKRANKPRIVSVGSGNGRIEWEYLNYHKNENIRLYCVDPAPESHRKYVPNKCVIPHYKSVKELISEDKSKGKSTSEQDTILLLIWPPPPPVMSKTSDATIEFDVEAIQLLNPSSIILIYEQFGAAGSTSLHTFLSLIKWEAKCKYQESKNDPRARAPDISPTLKQQLKPIAAQYMGTASFWATIPGIGIPMNEELTIWNSTREGIILLDRSNSNVSSKRSLPTTEWVDDTIKQTDTNNPALSGVLLLKAMLAKLNAH